MRPPVIPHVAGLRSPARCLVMGILNVTPDSFSDGGLFDTPARAVERGFALHAQGADLVDVGGESTRPGAARPTPEEELDRVVPVVRGLVELGVPVSVDTMRASVAVAACEEGAVLVNDVSGGLADPEMLDTVAGLGVAYVLMHWRGHSATMHQHTSYDDVVADVRAELEERLAAAVAAGIDPARIALDPGIGFAKTFDQNWALLGRLPELVAAGQPVLIGLSRKRFLGELLATDGDLRPPRMRDDASLAAAVLAAAAGAWCVRTHEVAAVVDAMRVVARVAADPGSPDG